MHLSRCCGRGRGWNCDEDEDGEEGSAGVWGKGAKPCATSGRDWGMRLELRRCDLRLDLRQRILGFSVYIYFDETQHSIGRAQVEIDERRCEEVRTMDRSSFSIFPPQRWTGGCAPMKRPKVRKERSSLARSLMAHGDIASHPHAQAGCPPRNRS